MGREPVDERERREADAVADTHVCYEGSGGPAPRTMLGTGLRSPAPGVRMTDPSGAPTRLQPGPSTIGRVGNRYSPYVDFQVLGPLSAFDGDDAVDLGGPKQRLVLAILLAAHGSSVSIDALIDGVWDDSPPATARKTLQGYVHHLRSRVSGGLETDKAGYSLEVRDDRVDERRFTAAMDDARALAEADPIMASDLLAGALGLWRGTPYADLDAAPVLLPEITRLTEARLVALGDRIEADLELGGHDMLVAELESLTVDNPFHERFRGLLMIALYRSGRHGEALRAYSRTRDQFVEEMGIEPSDKLRALEHRMLDRDPTLDLQVETTRRAPTAPRAIRGYELREQISTDMSSTLYRGYQRSVGREVAIKVTGSELANDPAFIARYESDVARVAALNHPNIVYVQDTWREPGRAFQVMRWIDGERLDVHLAARRPSDWTALKIIELIGGALTAAHRGGVVHGDIRAATALVTADGDTLLTDFVVGRDAGDEAGDRIAFARLAYHVLFGVEPCATDLIEGLLDSTVTSPESRAVFEAALGGGEPPCADEFVRELRRALGGDVVELAGEITPLPRSDARCPYKGLQAFQTSDAADFFGRDGIVDRLDELVRRCRLVAVVGPSGSGKSSIVKAGLLPRLLARPQPMLVAEMYPGAYPFDSLARALRTVAVTDGASADRLVADSGGLSRVIDAVLPVDSTELLLVIDQFEELFAAVSSESTRALFLDSIVRAVTVADSRLRVVLTLRGDFFDRPLRYAEFGALVEAGLLPVAMPSDDELAAAIERPAAAVGVVIEPRVAGEMIRDVADEPGALPLLQYALTDLFERRTGDTLTVEAYRESGGVLGSLAARADELFADLDDARQRAMQQAFLRMVSVDESAKVRRRVTRAELGALEVDSVALDEGLQRFGAHRLLTFDSDPISRAPTVEVAHEALLQEWGRLRRWIEDQREQLVVRRRLDAAVQEWEDSGEHTGYLLRGRRLAQFDDWATDTDMALSASERAFLQVSREHDEAQARTAASRRRRVMLALGVAAAVAVVFGIYAVIQRNEAADEAFAAETARLGGDAGFVVESDRQLALLMAIETYRRDPGIEGLSALQRVLVDAGPYLGNLAAGHRYREVSWVTDDRLVAVSDREVHLLDATTGDVTVLPIEPPSAPIGGEDVTLAVIRAHTPAGLAAVATAGDAIVLVDVLDGSVETFAAAAGSRALAISDDGTTVAIGRADGMIELVDRASSEVIAGVLANQPRSADSISLAPGVVLDEQVDVSGIDGLAFDSSGGRIVSVGGILVRAWSTDDLSPLGPEIVNAWGEDDFNLVATRPSTFWFDELDADVLVVAGESFVVRWRMSTGERLSLHDVGAELAGAAPAGGGSVLLLADDGSVVRRSFDDLGRDAASFTTGADFVFDTQEREVSSLAVDGRRNALAVATDDGIVTASLDGGRIIARSVPIGSSDTPTLTRDGEMLAVGLASDGLFDLTTAPPGRRAFDVEVEVAQFAGSPATFELTSTTTADVILWTSDFVEIRNAYDLDSGDYLGDFWGPYVPAWSDDGRRVARAPRAGGTHVGEPGTDWPGYTSARSMASADFDSTAGRVVVVSADLSPAVLVDLETGSERQLPDMPGGLVAAAFTPDDNGLITIGGSGDVWLLDAESLERTGVFDDVGAVAGSVHRPPVMAGGLLFAATDGVARIWHLESGRQIGKPFPVAAGGRPAAIADRTTLRLVTPLDGEALIWNLDVDEWVDLACRAAGRNMSEVEWMSFGARDTGHRTTCPESEGD